MKKGLIALLIFCLFYACTPYDSNKVNKQLLQGTWLLQDLYYISSDSILISEYKPKDSVTLLFDEDNYKEYIGVSHETVDLMFNVSDYRIMFYQDSSIYDWTNIEALSPDSLVLSKANRIWKYKKIK